MSQLMFPELPPDHKFNKHPELYGAASQLLDDLFAKGYGKKSELISIVAPYLEAQYDKGYSEGRDDGYEMGRLEGAGIAKQLEEK